MSVRAANRSVAGRSGSAVRTTHTASASTAGDMGNVPTAKKEGAGGNLGGTRRDARGRHGVCDRVLLTSAAFARGVMGEHS
jgi:hypothetical protein